MSKAFTSGDAPNESALVRDPPQLAPGERRYITPEGFKALQEELGRLGPKSENPRAQWLRATLPLLTVAAPEAASGRVVFGAWVTVEDDEGAQKTYRLVGPDETDAKRGLISISSPLARALLLKEEGDTAVVTTPGGRRELTIVGVRYS